MTIWSRSCTTTETPFPGASGKRNNRPPLPPLPPPATDQQPADGDDLAEPEGEPQSPRIPTARIGAGGKHPTKGESGHRASQEGRQGGQGGHSSSSSPRQRRRKPGEATAGTSLPESQQRPRSSGNQVSGAAMGRAASHPRTPPTSTEAESHPLDYRLVIAAFLVVLVAIVLVWKVVPALSSPDEPPVAGPDTGEPGWSQTAQDRGEPGNAIPPASPSESATSPSRITPIAMVTITATHPRLETAIPIPTASATPAEVMAPTGTTTPTATLPPTPTATTIPTATPTTTPTIELTPTEVVIPTATPAPPEPPPPPPPPPRTYTVQEGDTVRSIAQEWGVSVEDILQWNNMTPEEADAISTGQELVVSP
ncbi:MAG: LysM peptidoglycan-binding domain-containing protein [Chloroflexaceae bacterium]|nr:LysM peptidoglycan-binding domain-containing protein [Chloroflexaceae bacterium]